MTTAFQSDAFQADAFQIDGAAAPEIEVSGNGVVIANGDATPSLTDHTDFGSTTEGGSTISRVFQVANLGTADLNVGSVTVPTGFTLVDGLPLAIIPGAGNYDEITIRLDTAVPGVKSGNVSFSTDDSDENPFTFAITGTVTAAPPPPPPPPSGSAGAGQFIGKYFDPSIHGLLHAQRRARNSIR